MRVSVGGSRQSRQCSPFKAESQLPKQLLRRHIPLEICREDGAAPGSVTVLRRVAFVTSALRPESRPRACPAHQQSPPRVTALRDPDLPQKLERHCWW